jgi:PEP-CTERM motif-containing protein
MNASATRWFSVFSLAVAGAIVAAQAYADPIKGRDVLKFSQRPMLDTPLTTTAGLVEHFHGHDEFSTAYSQFNALGKISGYQGIYMADDFADEFKTPVVHLKWWGSYLNRPTTHPEPVQRFLVSFESDSFCTGPNGAFSCPGQPLLNQIVSMDADGVLTPGSGTFTEKKVGDASREGDIFEYNAELHLKKEFPQEPNQVYWLKVVALVDTPTDTPFDQRIQWGWHNRDYTIPNPLASPAVIPGETVVGVLPTFPLPTPVWHFQDDAVQGNVAVDLDPLMPIMPIVRQPGIPSPKSYLVPWDGPAFPLPIDHFSKDLAFEVYTIPEPATVMLVAVALVGCGSMRRRHRV